MTRIAPVVVAVLTLAACSGSGGDGSAASRTPSEDASATSVPGLGDESAAASPDGEEWLFALTADGAAVAGDTVTLTDVSATTAAFTDRPARRSRVMSTPGLLASWDDVFGDVAPNASISGTADGAVVDGTVEITGVSSGARPGEVVLAVRPLAGTALPASLADVTVVVDDVALGQCTPQVPWWVYEEMPAELIQAELAATRLELSATSPSEPVEVSITAPLLARTAESVQVSVEADTSAGPIGLPAARTPALASDGDGDEFGASIPAPEGWAPSGSTVGSVLVQVTIPLPGIAGGSQVCRASVGLGGG